MNLGPRHPHLTINPNAPCQHKGFQSKHFKRRTKLCLDQQCSCSKSTSGTIDQIQKRRITISLMHVTGTRRHALRFAQTVILLFDTTTRIARKKKLSRTVKLALPKILKNSQKNIAMFRQHPNTTTTYLDRRLRHPHPRKENLPLHPQMKGSSNYHRAVTESKQDNEEEVR